MYQARYQVQNSFYAPRGSTRYELFDALRDAFGFTPLSCALRTTI